METIFEVLENALHNLKGKQDFQRELGINQLANSLYLIRYKDYDLDSIFDEEDLDGSAGDQPCYG